MTTMVPDVIRSRPMRWLIICIVIAGVLAAQGLALAHGISHVRLASMSAAPFVEPGARVVGSSTANGSASGDHVRDGTSDLFGAHSTEQDCRLYDQLARADVVWSAWLPPSPTQTPTCIRLAPAGSQVEFHKHASFAARAPPALF